LQLAFVSTKLPQENAERKNSMLLRVREAAQKLAMSRSTLYALMDGGQLPYVKIGKARRLEESAVQALIERGRVGCIFPPVKPLH
jgi:excisionase family DNA binding protein